MMRQLISCCNSFIDYLQLVVTKKKNKKKTLFTEKY